MKREVVKELEYALDEIDVLKNNIDEIGLPDDVIELKNLDITNIQERINKVMTTLKQEIDFDDALKGVGAVPVITGDKDTDALLEDERLNQENCDGLLYHTINDIDNKLGQYAEEIIHSYGNELNPDEIMKAINDIQVDWWNHGEPKLKHEEKLRIISRYKQLDREHKIDWRRSCQKN
tara:strand:+ start:164 stop:697 length:534 start_codon:yes stop_codon:yes gene_type:complete